MRKVAVIGLGSIASRHRKNLKTLFPDACVYSMSSSGRTLEENIPDADKLVSSINDLILIQVQLVIIASPAPFHASHAMPLIEANIPVLIEKPITMALKDAEAIKLAVKRYNTAATVGYCLRYLSSAIKMKEYIDSEMIGQLYHAFVEVGQYLPDWRPDKNYKDSVSANSALGGGVLLELSHELDYVRWLLGPLHLDHAILRSSNELGLDVEDSADVLLHTDNKAVIHVHLDFLQRQAYRKCRLVGSKGVLEWDLIRNEVNFVSSLGNTLLYSAPDWDKNQMYLSMVSEFVANREKYRAPTVLDDAIETLSLVNNIKSNYSIVH
ncbi:oxidoreductase [Marinomonas sp. CT5]|uniref:Gfo/Idh/MocA family protein n=1 Tax=Marinomonas sp. CT5 TaxID=2066133 RepID=UPI001BAF0196|nr:Gfo/Idh/MocA family oxidoreductase [Marinomonas sp. CT5]QUX94507.1 oxidoreductase [Marinomonas sp. CT5]